MISIWLRYGFNMASIWLQYSFAKSPIFKPFGTQEQRIVSRMSARFYRTPFSVNLVFNNLKIYDYGKS